MKKGKSRFFRFFSRLVKREEFILVVTWAYITLMISFGEVHDPITAYLKLISLLFSTFALCYFVLKWLK